MTELKKKKGIIIFSVAVMAVFIGLVIYLSLGIKTDTSLQTTDTVLMVSPVAFDYNEETAVNNAFQEEGDESNTAKLARKESDAYVQLLKDNGINVITVKDTKKPNTPDSVFPNNWFSTHSDGTFVLYPMFAENRRLERKPAALAAIEANFNKKRTVDLTHYEKKGLFLEGTGKTIVEISFDQMNHFAGNMLELRNKKGEPCLVMSLTAYESLSDKQIDFLKSKMKLITPDLDCIEQNGGGSARCMIAEIFQSGS